MSIVGYDEAVQVQVEPILHGGTVDFGNEPARARKAVAIEAEPPT
jgi:hypothetical protein